MIAALGGDDRISGLGGDDVVCAGPGDDLVTGSHSYPLQIDLGGGNDRVIGLDVGELYAGAGDDYISVERRSGYLSLGPGDDRLVVHHRRPRGPARFTPCVVFHSATAPVHVNLTKGRATGQGHDRLVNARCVTLSRYDDVIAGTAFGDYIEAGAGRDLVRTGGGIDEVYGGPGADRIYLGPGNDDGTGGAGRDRLYGEAGSDSLAGKSGADYLDGGTGNDQVAAGFYCDIVNPTLVAYFADDADEAGNEVFGGPDDDYLNGDAGNDRLDGGPGSDYGNGGFHDHRIDWITSLEHPVDGCLSWDVASPFEPFEPPLPSN